MPMQEANASVHHSVPRFATQRTLLAWVAVLTCLSVTLSVAHYYQSRNQVRYLMRSQAENMASTITKAEQYVSRALTRVEEEQAARLAAVGTWLRSLDEKTPLGFDDLERVAEETGVFNIILFDAAGERELGFRGPRRGGRGMGQQGRHGSHPPVKEFLASGEALAIRGRHVSRGRGDTRFSVLVRRPNGGAITVQLSDAEQERLRNETSPDALLKEFSGAPGVAYLERRSGGETIRYDDGPETASDQPETFEIETSIPGRPGETLAVGYDATPLRAAERDLLSRLLFSAGVLAGLGGIGLVWTRLRKSHGVVAESLRRIRSYHRILMERMDDAALVWEEGGGLTFWNARAESLFPELKRLQEGNPPPAEVLRIVRAAEDSNGEQVLSLQGSESESRRFRVTAERLDEPGPTQMLFLSDVTMVEQATSERHRREHFEALAKVASGVAHEVRNPLNAIDMTIQTLCIEPSTLQMDDRETLEGLRTEIARINGIVEHFLAYGRPQPPAWSDVDPAMVVSEVASLLAPVAEEKRVELIDESVPMDSIRADAQHLRQAVMNVTLNAIEACDAEARVSLRLSSREDQVVIECVDEGAGMSSEQIERLFDPYVTTKAGGTGLGMSIVQRIVETHSGQITIQSQPGQGTEVLLRFPKSPGTASDEVNSA